MPFLMKPRTCSFCCLLCLLLAFPVPKFLGIRLRGVVMCQQIYSPAYRMEDFCSPFIN